MSELLESNDIEELRRHLKALLLWQKDAREYMAELEADHERWLKAEAALGGIAEAADALAKACRAAQQLQPFDALFKDLAPFKNLMAARGAEPSKGRRKKA